MPDERDVASLLIHVGADTSNLGYVGPVFRDKSFEYLPMLEQLPTKNNPTYKNIPIRSDHRRYGENLSAFVPEEDADERVHLDPKFGGEYGVDKDVFTYGENQLDIERVWKLNEGGSIFFVCSLAPYDSRLYRSLTKVKLIKHQRGHKNKYVIGYFTVVGMGRVRVTPTSSKLGFDGKATRKGSFKLNDTRKNQHFDEAIGERTFIVVKGNPKRSALLRCVLPITRKQYNHSFLKNPLGKELFPNSDTDSFRGLRNLNSEQTRTLIAKIEDYE